MVIHLPQELARKVVLELSCILTRGGAKIFQAFNGMRNRRESDYPVRCLDRHGGVHLYMGSTEFMSAADTPVLYALRCANKR